MNDPFSHIESGLYTYCKYWCCIIINTTLYQRNENVFHYNYVSYPYVQLPKDIQLFGTKLVTQTQLTSTSTIWEFGHYLDKRNASVFKRCNITQSNSSADSHRTYCPAPTPGHEEWRRNLEMLELTAESSPGADPVRQRGRECLNETLHCN